MKTIVLFNNKGGVGKTTLAYHISYMLSELGYRTLAVDLDPQANLTSMFLSEERLTEIFDHEDNRPTLLAALKPLTKGTGDILPANIERISESIGLIPGDLELSVFEDKLSDNWNKCLNREEAAFRVVSSFYRIIAAANAEWQADFNIIDVGPNFGAINRAILIAADYVVIPMAADLFSLQGLRNLGKTLEVWQEQWADRVSRNPEPTLQLPNNRIKPLGYVVMQHGIKEKRPVKSYMKWADRIPSVFRTAVLHQSADEGVSVETDSYCMALLKHYHSLIPMAMEIKKPIFMLKPADGAIGGHQGAVQAAYDDFKRLTQKIIALT
jgi:chromosome partitioning protein